MIDLNFLTLEQFIEPIPEHIPDVTPVSFRDIDMLPPMDLMLSCSDPCPKCGAFNMQVGDYVYMGICFPCTEGAYSEIGESE